MSDAPCPFKFEHVDTVPEGVTLTQYDRFSMFEFNWMKGVHLIINSTPKEERTDIRLFYEETREIWSLTLPGGSDNAGQIGMMNALIRLNDMGMI